MAEKHLVVGGTGGIGRAVVRALTMQGMAVRALVRNRGKAARYFSGLGGIEIIEGDAASRADVDRALQGMSTLFYCAHVPYPRWERELLPLFAVSLEAASAARAKVVFPGNVYVYGHAQHPLVNEDHPHAAHTRKGKLRIAMEQMLLDAQARDGLRHAIVRMPDFYGPFVVNGFSELLLQRALAGSTVFWPGNLDVPYEAIFIDDAGEAMVTAGLSDRSTGRSFNVPGSAVTTPRTFLQELVRQAGTNSSVRSVNSPLLVGFAGLFDPVIREFKEMMYLKREQFLLDGSRYSSTFGKLPATPYAEGIARSLQWFKTYSLPSP